MVDDARGGQRSPGSRRPATGERLHAPYNAGHGGRPADRPAEGALNGPLAGCGSPTGPSGPTRAVMPVVTTTTATAPPPLLHPAQPGCRWRLAGRPGFRHRGPRPDARRLRTGLLREAFLST